MIICCCDYLIMFFANSYHKRHFLRGFIGDPSGQLKASENSLELITVPITRNRDGEWDPYFIVFLIDSFLSFSHQIWAKKR